jgi:hypothetical protein
MPPWAITTYASQLTQMKLTFAGPNTTKWAHNTVLPFGSVNGPSAFIAFIHTMLIPLGMTLPALVVYLSMRTPIPILLLVTS